MKTAAGVYEASGGGWVWSIYGNGYDVNGYNRYQNEKAAKRALTKMCKRLGVNLQGAAKESNNGKA